MKIRSPKPNFSACSGCGLCAIPCPVWQQTRDIRLTPWGRAKALQGGATAEELSDSAASCVMCGACEPICPENIDTVAMTLDLRATADCRLQTPDCRPPSVGARPVARNALVLLPGAALSSDPAAMAASVAALHAVWRGPVAVAEDDGRDIAAAIEAGRPMNGSRVARFIEHVGPSFRLVAVEGMLHRFLKSRLPCASVTGLGETLVDLPAVRRALGPSDLYVIETRGFHADYARLVRLYDALRHDTGCQTNLDLQRMALATGAGAISSGRVDPAVQARWILEGRSVKRIVVEDLADAAAFRKVTEVPVVHVAMLGR